MIIARIGLALQRDGSAPADVHLDGTGSLAVVRDAEAVGQHVGVRLMAYQGEWFLDKTAGVPWFRELMGGAYDAALAESVMKAVILDTDGVTGINSFSVRFDRSTRGLSAYNISVSTEYDEDAQA